MLGNKKKTLSIVYNDFMVSMLAVVGSDLSKGITYQIPLQEGIVQHGRILDPDAFYRALQTPLKNLKIKKYHVRVIVPNHDVEMKQITIPENLTRFDEVDDYIFKEIGKSIHLAFETPIVDIYDEDPTDGEAMLFATERNEVDKIIEVVESLGQIPEVVDIKSLANLRTLEKVMPSYTEKTSMILDWSINEVTMSIVENHHVKLLRTHTIPTTQSDWMLKEQEAHSFTHTLSNHIEMYMDELSHAFVEIQHICQFYEISLNKGMKQVQQLIVLGDHPMLPKITELLRVKFPLEVVQITDEQVGEVFATYQLKHCSLLGLEMKEASMV
ncbi:hypothetical protein D6T70_04420 [Kurthia gibsonii]|uniref:Pilus assembly protein PilM n=1 Tax=Kurthia gibsonii TaxID=33946 RepID=A0ABU9LHG1_9BACL|nr:pilus assembly protein PilM [Kurthia gibsonii]RXH52838.1 hypothetical protein D6T70_04420 [Kurthia gibsonii]HZG12906.1 pilus assembly protein PilM [Kurthia gibsonii]